MRQTPKYFILLKIPPNSTIETIKVYKYLDSYLDLNRNHFGKKANPKIAI